MSIARKFSRDLTIDNGLAVIEQTSKTSISSLLTEDVIFCH